MEREKKRTRRASKPISVSPNGSGETLSVGNTEFLAQLDAFAEKAVILEQDINAAKGKLADLASFIEAPKAESLKTDQS